MHKSALLFFFAFISLPAVAKPKMVQDTIVMSGAKFRLEAVEETARDLDFCGPAGIGRGVSYRIWKNGKVMRPQATIGPLYGCRSGYGQQQVFKRVEVEGKSIGWIIYLIYGINPVYWNSHFIAVQANFAKYGVRALSSDREPLIRKVGEKYEIWLSRTEERHGTASQFPIYSMESITLSNPNLLGDGYELPLNSDLKSWPEGFQCKSFPSCFVSGLRNHNPDVMTSALEFFEPKEAESRYKDLNLPSSREEAEAFIANYRKFHRTFQDYQN